MVKKLRRLFRIVRVAYYNFGDGPDQIKVEDLEEIYNEDVDLIGLSEHADRVDVTTRFIRAHPEFGRYYGDGRPGAAKECILYRKSLGEVTLMKTHTVVEARRLPPGAGPENAGPKCVHRIRIKVRKRRRSRRLHFVVGHQYATINSRKEAARLFMNAVVDILRARVGAIVFVSDQNAEPKHVILRALRALMPSWSKTGSTHKNRIIDYIMVRGGRILKSWTKKLSSDHKVVIADVRI